MVLLAAEAVGLSPAMVMTLLGGLALFLFGMEQMTGTLKVVTGERMRSLLEKLTTNRVTGVLAGAVVTSIVQSSSLTTVLVVGFVSAGLMTLTQSMGVIMGAEIGTTITAQIVAFNVTKSALALVALGFAWQFLIRREPLRQYGTMVFGLGLLFFGMNVMSDATEPLRHFPPFIEAVQRLDNRILGVLLAAAFTAVIQSSSATTVLLIVLANQGLVTLHQAIPLVFGANIGTCITAVLASIGKSRDAVRAAFVHVTFKVLGVLLWISFVDELDWCVRQLSSDISRQIANAHTLFNVSNTMIFIWLTIPLARFVTWLVPDRPEIPSETARPKYLDEILLQTPSLAINSVRLELGRLGVAALNMARNGLATVLHGDAEALDRLKAMDDDVDSLHGAIVTYLGRLSTQALPDTQTQQIHGYLLVANYFENIGDLIETDLVVVGRQRREAGLMISPATEELLTAIHHEVCWAVEHSIRALVDEDLELARQVTAAKSDVNRLVATAEEHLSRRLAATAPNRLIAYRLESEIMEYLKRMYYFAKRVARIAASTPEEPSAAVPPNSGLPQTSASAPSATMSIAPSEDS
ncbi:Na/Pi cotransporter family protein [bacterium]|nr:Na/Pi cotransporter family protein [bacterium]